MTRSIFCAVGSYVIERRKDGRVFANGREITGRTVVFEAPDRVTIR